MLDINLFRVEKGGNPELIRESQRRRFANVELVDEVIAIDKQWRQRKNLYLFLSTKSLVWIYLCFLNLGFGFFYFFGLQFNSIWRIFARTSTRSTSKSLSFELWVFWYSIFRFGFSNHTFFFFLY